MSVNYSLDKKEILLNEEESIIINASEEEGYETRKVKFKTKNEEIYVGAYCPNDGIDNYGTVLFNNRFIMILTRNRRDGITIVNTVFDMQSKKENNVLKDSLNEKYRDRFIKKYNSPDKAKIIYKNMKKK